MTECRMNYEALSKSFYEQQGELRQAKEEIKFLDHQIQMLERRNTRQARHLEKIYKLIRNKEWDKLTALYMDTKQDYEEII
ncbi:MAG: hypothetical protein IJQ68_10455 [Methanobrevibacter sp.]|uniref:hypothetical protein n=1 Tax=Methanobrevibacter sp. TaxID=66852 RepID=UPI0025D52197|nr:hypothetical protein [Methanobrevibacter sp.]MBR0272388.1 hypothetical protein [Methanobrevibacter sp.]